MNDVDYSDPLNVLRKGGVILYPTDTIPGLGCDGTNEAAIAKIFRLKKRIAEKSLIILVDTIDRINEYAQAPLPFLRSIIEEESRPLTIIYPAAKNLAANLISADGTVAIRVCRDPLCNELIRRFNRPIVSTSANFSGEPAPQRIAEVSPELARAVDLIVPDQPEKTKPSAPSRILQWDGAEGLKIIRE